MIENNIDTHICFAEGLSKFLKFFLACFHGHVSWIQLKTKGQLKF